MEKREFCAACAFFGVGSVLLMFGCACGWAGVITGVFVCALSVYEWMRNEKED